MRHRSLPTLIVATLLTACGEEASTSIDATTLTADDAARTDDAATSADDPDAVVSVEDTVIVMGTPITVEGNASGVSIETDRVTVTEGRSYFVRGTGTNQRVIVDSAGQDVTLRLAGVDITNTGEPAIVFAASASSTVLVEAGSVNHLTGGNDTYDGALYSVASLVIDGEGELHIDGNVQEGIATEMHLDIRGANTWVSSVDDGLNANNDGVSVITISGGFLHVLAGGDGIDSNGSIVISGGTVIAVSRLSSDPNTGLDADLGVSLRGGVVVATGAGGGGGGGGGGSASTQASVTRSGSGAEGSRVVVVDASGAALVAFDAPAAYSRITLSTPTLTSGTSYTLYSGGEVTGTARDGLYTDVTAYTPGTALGSVTASL